jgi:hypothetical protein
VCHWCGSRPRFFVPDVAAYFGIRSALGLLLIWALLFRGGCHCGQLSRVSDWFGDACGVWISGLHNPPSSDNMDPTLAQVHLLGRGPGPFGFRGRRLARGRCPVTLSRRLLCKGRPRSPLSTSRSHGSSPCGRSRICSTEGALGGLGSHQKGETTTRDAPEGVSSIPLSVAKTLAAFTLYRALRCHECHH